MSNITLNYKIEKSDEKKYFFLAFDVPEGVESMEIKYSYAGDTANSRVSENEKNVIDFGLIDEKGGDVGTRGSNTRYCFISPSFSTSGYKRKPINAGKWQIIIGAYQIRSEGVTVSYDICFNMKKFRWLKGDTHIHTNHSDGKYTRQEIALKARKKGLDFIILTDHNNNLEGANMPEIQNLTVIKGLEFTNYKGHMNIFGLEKPYDGTYAINNIEELKKCNLQAKERGGLQVLNHPTCTLCPWLLGYDSIHYDALEVWNGPMRKDNLKAVELWNEQLKARKRVSIIGGSDFHKDYFVTDLFAHPTLFVYADSNDPDSILKGIKNGNCFITSSPKATTIDMSYNSKKMGDEAQFDENQKVKVNIAKMKKTHKFMAVDNSGVCFEYKAKKSGNYEFEIPVRQKGYMWCKIEYKKSLIGKLLHKLFLYFFIRKQAYEKVPPFIYTITNPIYIK